jgi:hypothetical protein
MSAFELSRAAVDDQDGEAGAEGGPDVVVQDGEYTIRESDSAWLSAENPVEVTQ